MRNLFAVSLMAQVLAISGLARAELPEGWVLSPGGPALKSRIIEVAPTVRVEPVRVASEVLGHSENLLEISALRGKPASDNGWITYSLWTPPEGDQLGQFTSAWQVPEAPATQGTQLLYLFNSLMPSHRSAILQPVLQWGVSPAGGGRYWAVASWYVTADGTAYHSPLVKVQPGQLLTGVMTLTHIFGTQYSYRSEFEGIAGTQLSVDNIEILSIASETLEAYGVTDCTQYPTDATTFSAIEFTLAGAVNAIPWSIMTGASDCGQHTEVLNPSDVSGEVAIHYH